MPRAPLRNRHSPGASDRSLFVRSAHGGQEVAPHREKPVCQADQTSEGLQSAGSASVAETQTS